MNQAQKRLFLIQSLLDESPRYRELDIPSDETEQKRLLRSLMNVRAPGEIGADFLAVQDEYLQAATAEKGVTDLADLTPVQPDLYLWRGDITALRCGAIVNAANSGMTGCYQPCHNCIDKAAPTSITQVYNKRIAVFRGKLYSSLICLICTSTHEGVLSISASSSTKTLLASPAFINVYREAEADAV